MLCISFSLMEESKYFLFWFIALILRIIRYITNKQSDLKENMAKIVERFGEIFLIFFFFFEKYLSKNKNITNSLTIINKKNINSNCFKQNKKYFFILIIILLRIICVLFKYPTFFIYIKNNNTTFIDYISQILILILLSNFFGIKRYYSHHYLSILLIFSSFIINF